MNGETIMKFPDARRQTRQFSRQVVKGGLLVALSAAAIAVAVAHPGGGHEEGGWCPHEGGPGHHTVDPAQAEKHQAERQARMADRVSDALVLDAAQKTKLTALLKTWHEARQAERPAESGKSMQALIAGDKFDQAAAKAMIEKRSEALRTRSPEVIKTAAAFFDSLRPEQQQKVRRFLAHGPMRHGFMGMGGPAD
jgi:periplasmic protein CpxP/Spy